MITDYKNKIKDLLSKLEATPLVFRYFFITLLSITIVRVFLESFSDPVDLYWQILPAPVFIHYCLGFVMTFLAIALVIRIFSRTSLVKIFKVQILFFPIIIFPPVFDLIVSWGQGIDMAYVTDKSLSELAYLFITYFGSLEDSGITIGMRIEIVIICLAAALYVYLKRAKILAALATLVFAYLACFLFVTTPNITALIGNLNYNHPLMGSDNFFSFIYLATIVLELLLLLYFYNPQKFIAFIKNVRPYRIIHYEGMLLGGFLLGKIILGYDFQLWQLLAAMLAVVLAWLSQVGLNDLIDVDIDKISNADRPLIKGVINVKEYKVITFLLACLALVVAYSVSYHFLIFIMIFMVLYTVYSMPPLKLKRIPILATFLIASAALSLVMAGFSLPGHEYLVSFPSYLIGLILISLTFSVTMKDVKDIEGDKAAGIMTVPTLLGSRSGKKAVGVLVLLSYLVAPLLLPRFFPSLLGLALIFGVISYFVINKKHYQERYVFWTYFGFYIILAYYFGEIYL